MDWIAPEDQCQNHPYFAKKLSSRNRQCLIGRGSPIPRIHALGLRARKLSLKAAWDTIQRLDEEAKIYTLKSGRQVLTETEAITITHTAEMARATANAINRKSFVPAKKC